MISFPAEFAAEMAAYLPTGISFVLGGCCGSEPESIRLLKELTQDKPPAAKPSLIARPLPVKPVRCVEVNGITVVASASTPLAKSACSRPCGRATAPMPAPRP